MQHNVGGHGAQALHGGKQSTKVRGMNMRIAVLLGGVGYDSQRRTLGGILDRALLDGTSVCIFTCGGWKYELPSKYEEGEYSIYTLPDFTQYDGVILGSDTIHDTAVTEGIIRRIMEADIPCVELNALKSCFMQVEMENRAGMEEIVRHLIVRHNANSIYFISGPMYSYDARVRLQVYKDTMIANYREWQEDSIYYGDYSFESGRRAVEKFLSAGSGMPDAIVAVNDEMAVGAILALKEAGYRVPEDVMVTGYDDSIIAAYSHPRLTTVRRGEYEAGQIAYEKLIAVRCGDEAEQRTVIQGSAVFADSCGCTARDTYSLDSMKDMYISEHVRAYRDMERLKNSSAEFTAQQDLEGLLECLEQYIRDMGLEYFYLCLCGNVDGHNGREALSEQDPASDGTTVYSDDIWIPFAYEKGEVNSYGRFHRSELLPPECRIRRMKAYGIIMPLHFQDHCFGYCVAGNYRPAIEGTFYQNFILNLDNALEMIRRQNMLRRLQQGFDTKD